MQVDAIIDRVLGEPHGNWERLRYGELAFVWFLVQKNIGDKKILFDKS
jgi:hypothetical protein